MALDRTKTTILLVWGGLAFRLFNLTLGERIVQDAVLGRPRGAGILSNTIDLKFLVGRAMLALVLWLFLVHDPMELAAEHRSTTPRT